jgi:hypothetical protein
MLDFDLADPHVSLREVASTMKRFAHEQVRLLQGALAIGALVGAAPAFGQCLYAELGPEPSFPVPPHLDLYQIAIEAQVAPQGSPTGEAELFRLWLVPATLEVLRVSALGAATPAQTIRLESFATLPAVTNGTALEVDGDWLVISTYDLINQHVVADQGKVLVYRRTAGRWTFAQLLVPSGSPGRFGSSVAIEGDRIVVGDKLASTVHVFDRTVAGWQESARIPDPSVGRLAISGDRFVVGRPGDLSPVIVPGARIYDRDASGNWALAASIAPPAGMDPIYFGSSPALDGDTAMFGDHTYTTPQLQRGAVAVYSRTGAGWAHVDTLLCPSGLEGSFGHALDLDGADLVVGAGFNGLTRHRLVGGAWILEATFRRDSRVDASRGLRIVADRVFTGTLDGGVQVVPWRPLGAVVDGCATSTNSSGSAVNLYVLTTPSASGAPLELYVSYPTGTPGSTGLLLAGPSAAQLPLGGGVLCAGGGIVRIGQLGPPNDFLGMTTIVAEVDPALHPGLIQPGNTVHLQYWYADPLGHPRGNLSNSVAVTYCP